MSKPKVLISDKMDPNAAKIFEERGCDVDVITGETPEELKARIGEYDGLAIRSSTKVTSEILDAATNLKVIGRAGIGVDNVDIPYASGTASGARARISNTGIHKWMTATSTEFSSRRVRFCAFRTWYGHGIPL